MQNIFHIGIPKSGTTSIQDTLGNDERIYVTRSRYFTSKDWWTEQQEFIPKNKIIIESNETLISGGFQKVKFIQVVERMYKTNENAKIIITIREQKSALKSMFKYHINNNFEGCNSFQNWMYNSNLGIDYISLCMYGNIAKSLLSYFPKSNIHFLFFEELKYDPLKFYKKLYSILEIPFNIKCFKDKALNVMPLSDDQLYTLAKLNLYSFTKLSSIEKNNYKNLRTFENRIKKSIIRRFHLKTKQDFFSLDKIKNFQKVNNDFRNSNALLLEMGLIQETDFNKYNYMY